MMLDGADYEKVVLIDFEFSGMNNRAFDLATFYNECMITYKHQGDLPFKTYYEYALSKESVDEILEMYL